MSIIPIHTKKKKSDFLWRQRCAKRNFSLLNSIAHISAQSFSLTGRKLKKKVLKIHFVIHVNLRKQTLSVSHHHWYMFIVLLILINTVDELKQEELFPGQYSPSVYIGELLLSMTFAASWMAKVIGWLVGWLDTNRETCETIVLWGKKKCK